MPYEDLDLTTYYEPKPGIRACALKRLGFNVTFESLGPETDPQTGELTSRAANRIASGAPRLAVDGTNRRLPGWVRFRISYRCVVVMAEGAWLRRPTGAMAAAIHARSS